MTRSPSPTTDLLDAQRGRQSRALFLAALSAGAVAAAATLLLGLSGWFITGAAVAGAAGTAAVQAFNYLLPSAGIRGLAILRTGARYGERLFGHIAALQALAEIRPALFLALAAQPPETALGLSSGEASARMAQDVDALETLLVRLSAPWAGAAALASGVVLALLGGPGPAVAVVIAAVVLTVAARGTARRLSQAAGAQAQAAAGRLKAVVGAYAAAGPELACYGLGDRAVAAAMACERDLGRAKLQLALGEAALALLTAWVGGLLAAVVLFLAAPAGPAIAALAALAGLAALEGAGGLIRMFERQGAADEAVRRLDELFTSGPSAPPAPEVGGSLEIALPGTTAVLASGERVALTGASGAGKTRTVELMLGLRTSAKAARPRSLFAYAPQDARLLAGSVRENLMLAHPAADEAALWDALSDCALAERVRALPRGLDTWVGDAGERLSGGERRRLCLARALLRPAPWLVLDEPTEGLDAETEARVVDALEARLTRTGQGLILVSHRPAPLRLCGRRIEVVRD